MNKEKFGSFIKTSRIKKGYTQKELADNLFIDVTAISKWERGITYPDITLVPEICKVLDINEHELILSSNDTEYRKNMSDAKKYNKIKDTIFYVSSISYIIAILVCFIVNISVSHNLSWFFIVLFSCLTAFTFIPTCTRFFKKYKLTVFVFSTVISLFLLYLTCSIYTKNYWYLVATFGTLLGYFMIFYPIIFKKQEQYLHDNKYNRLKKIFMLTYSLGLLVLTLLLLQFINYYCGLSNMNNAVLITLYSFGILFIYGIVELFNTNRFIKIGIDTLLSLFYLIGLGVVLTKLLGDNNPNSYRINFFDWNNYTNGNVCFIITIIFVMASIIFIGLGLKKKKILN